LAQPAPVHETMELTDSQLDRYARHIVLHDIGGAGQQKLLSARVLVVGAGGLGAPCLHYLAAAGVGTLGIVDDDRVDLSNLQRQVIHRTADIGRAKTASAADAIAAINPDVKVILHNLRLTAENADEILRGYDIVADGSDSFATRFAVNDACVRLSKTLVSAAVGQFEGQLATFRGHEQNYPCYRCFVREAPGGLERSCAEAGVLGALTGVMGSFQALEVIREITGFGETMAGRLMIYDAMSSRIRTLKLPKDAECPVCSTHG
jgi:molybdopterin-synthase adenylyltransferase